MPKMPNGTPAEAPQPENFPGEPSFTSFTAPSGKAIQDIANEHVTTPTFPGSLNVGTFGYKEPKPLSALFMENNGNIREAGKKSYHGGVLPDPISGTAATEDWADVEAILGRKQA